MESGKALRKKVLEIISKNWPIHISGICRELSVKDSLQNISRIRYHILNLKKQNLVNTKKIDRALVIWPVDIEKIRVMHEFMKET